MREEGACEGAAWSLQNMQEVGACGGNEQVDTGNRELDCLKAYLGNSKLQKTGTEPTQKYILIKTSDISFL